MSLLATIETLIANPPKSVNDSNVLSVLQTLLADVQAVSTTATDQQVTTVIVNRLQAIDSAIAALPMLGSGPNGKPLTAERVLLLSILASSTVVLPTAI